MQSGSPVCFQRLTVLLPDAAAVQQLDQKRSQLSAWDLLAAQPTHDKAFQAVCKDADVDLITFDLTLPRLPFAPRTTTMNLAMQRGVYFELNLAGLFRDPESRRNTITNAALLIRMSRGHHLVISSGVSSLEWMRKPEEWVCLAALIGLDDRQAVMALSENPRRVVLHGSMRTQVCRGVLALSTRPHQRRPTVQDSASTWPSDASSKRKRPENDVDEGDDEAMTMNE